MATRLHVTEAVNELREDVSSLRTTIEISTKATENSVAKLAEDSNRIWTRLSGLNEEMMQRYAQAQQEKHTADRALDAEKLKQEQEKTKRMEQEREDARFINRVKTHWMPLFGVITAGAAAFAVALRVVEWVVRMILSG